MISILRAEAAMRAGGAERSRETLGQRESPGGIAVWP